MKKKIALTAAVAVASAAALVGSSFAFFNDIANGEVRGTVGNVKIVYAAGLELTNAENIDAGDNDPTNAENARHGTEHVMSFAVENTGNKSIVTRNIITISVKDSAGADLAACPFFLTACNLENGVMLMADGKEDIIHEFAPECERCGETCGYEKSINVTQGVESILGYVCECSEDCNCDCILCRGETTPVFAEIATKLYSADGVNFEEEKPADCKYVRYITTPVALNGATDSAGRETEAEIQDGDAKNGAYIGEDGTVVSYAYNLCMSNKATNEYQNTNITITVETQAMQYRNTSDTGWGTMFTSTLNAGTN